METIRQTNDEIEINMGELIGIIWHYFWIVAISAIVFAIASFTISKFVIVEQFESVTKIYILSKQDGNAVTYSDVQLGTQLTKDYAQLITSRDVLEKVISEMGLTETYEELEGKISVTTPTDTRIIAIAVTDENPENAQNIANSIREIAAVQIKNVMDIEAVNIVEKANLPQKPSSPSVPRWTIVGLLLGGILAAGIILVKYMLDDTIKTSEDVERYLGISMLAMIPIMENENTQKKKKHKRDKKDMDLEEYGEKLLKNEEEIIEEL